MPAMLLIPLRDSRVLVHVLDDVSPTDARVVSTEGDLAFLSAIRDDAHFCATEIIVEEILEPHTRDEQEVPAIRTTLLNVSLTAIAADFTVVLTGQAKRLVKLLEELIQSKLRRRLVRVVVLQERQTHHDVRHPLATRRVSDLLHVFHETRNVQKLRHRTHLFEFLVDHHRSTNTAVRVTAAGNLSPLSLWTVNEVREVGKRAHQ